MACPYGTPEQINSFGKLLFKRTQPPRAHERYVGDRRQGAGKEGHDAEDHTAIDTADNQVCAQAQDSTHQEHPAWLDLQPSLAHEFAKFVRPGPPHEYPVKSGNLTQQFVTNELQLQAAGAASLT